MALKWHVEGWRKIYITKSPSWLRLPVSARGLGRELLTYSDDLGRIDIGSDDPGEAIAYLLGARPKEHQRIREDVAELIREGYLTVVPGFLVIRNFVEAQDRTPGAKRTAEWRAKRTKPTSAEASSSAEMSEADETSSLREKSRFGASHVTSRETSHVTSHERHQETSPGDGGVMSPRDGRVTAIRSDPIRSESSVSRAHAREASSLGLGDANAVGAESVAAVVRRVLRSHRMTAFLDDREVDRVVTLVAQHHLSVAEATNALEYAHTELGNMSVSIADGCELNSVTTIKVLTAGIRNAKRSVAMSNRSTRAVGNDEVQSVDPSIEARAKQKLNARPPARGEL